MDNIYENGKTGIEKKLNIECKPGKYSDNKYLESYGVDRMRQMMTKRYGERYIKYREDWKLSENLKDRDFPVNLELDLIDACTLECSQCLRSSDFALEYEGSIGTGKKLDYAQIVSILDECYEHGLPSVNIGGNGECMMHPDFIQICSAIMEREVLELRIISNGTLLSNKIAEKLIDLQVHFVSISLDAATKDTYGAIRGRPDKYELVVENIMNLIKKRRKRGVDFPLLRVTFVRQKENNHEVEQFINFWSSYADLIDLQTFRDYRKSVYIDDFTCNQPWKRMLVYADGHVSPCCGCPGIKLDIGHIEENTLFDIWNGKRMRWIRSELRDKKYPHPCLKCMEQHY